MPYVLEANEALFQSNTEGLCRHRPHQHNEAVCGCRCGCGCSNVFHGNGNGQREDDQETLVDETNYFEEQREFPSPSIERPEQQVNIVNVESFTVQRQVPSWDRDRFGEMQAWSGGLKERTESFHTNQHTIDAEDEYLRLPGSSPHEEYDEGADSMANEPYASEDHSVISSDGRSVRCISPGPGIGGWVENDPLDQYHFVVRPLRLTPQRRYCRGMMGPNPTEWTEYPYDDSE